VESSSQGPLELMEALDSPTLGGGVGDRTDRWGVLAGRVALVLQGSSRSLRWHRSSKDADRVAEWASW